MCAETFLAALAGIAALGARSAEPAARPAVPVWTQLRMSASRLFVSAASTITVEQVPPASLSAALRSAPGGGGVPLPAAEVTVLTTVSELPFRRTERMTVWLDPASGAAIQAMKEDRGRSNYAKVFRYTSAGYHVWRSAPADATEAAGDPRTWSKRRESSVASPIPPPAPLTDPYALLYLVSAAELDRPGARLTVWIPSDHGAARVDFIAGRLTARQADFQECWPGGSRRRTGQVVVRTVVGTARALGESGGKDVDLGFLGMRDGLTILLENGTGIPIEFSGRVEKIGTVTVRLESVTLRQPR